MQECRPARGRVSAWRRGVFPGIAVLFLGTTLLRAQDVAEAARQEQARKGTESNSVSKHIYTEDDLKKGKILRPEDEARVAARRQKEQAAAETKIQQQNAEDPGRAESLGDIARRYRKDKASREREQTARKHYTPFPYDVPHPAVAVPKASVGPIREAAPSEKRPSFPDAVRPNTQRAVAESPGSHGRLSPFQPRPPVSGHAPAWTNLLPNAPMVTSRPASPAAGSGSLNRSEPGLKTVIVQPGDSWWRLASLYLGNGSRWNELRSLNPDAAVGPELLRSGARVLVPEARTTRADSGKPTASSIQLKLKAGDTLWKLAREHLGRGIAWKCLANANPQIRDYQRMAIGTVIDVPQTGVLGTCAKPAESLKK